MPNNEWEIACKEFLKGCTCAEPNHQEDCEPCLAGFCNKLRQLAIEQGYKTNTNCILLKKVEFGLNQETSPTAGNAPDGKGL